MQIKQLRELWEENCDKDLSTLKESTVEQMLAFDSVEELVNNYFLKLEDFQPEWVDVTIEELETKIDSALNGENRLRIKDNGENLGVIVSYDYYTLMELALNVLRGKATGGR